MIADAREKSRPTISVAMSTYVRETAPNLEASLASLAAQTRLPDEIVLVIDGPVGADQEAVIRRFAEDRRWTMRVVRLPENKGLAHALNEGLAACTGEIVLRMDSDDICRPDRIALQLEYLEAYPDVDVVASWCEDFFEDGAPPELKVAPTVHEAIVQALRWRNVIVHPSVAVRRKALTEVGGYSARFELLEDYDLWVRLAMAGSRFHIIPKVLMDVRASLSQRQRRGGFSYAVREIRFRIHLFTSGFISLRSFLATAALYAIFRLVSPSLRGRLYRAARVRQPRRA